MTQIAIGLHRKLVAGWVALAYTMLAPGLRQLGVYVRGERGELLFQVESGSRLLRLYQFGISLLPIVPHAEPPPPNIRERRRMQPGSGQAGLHYLNTLP